ncbi:putative F-box domain-containing protein [Medicago truncatula]|nr:F-box/kelch-repeat protein At3g23880 [Medicago truncatula]RHN51990.1 putative F-box domain-containing protein [Medicago truncatula]
MLSFSFFSFLSYFAIKMIQFSKLALLRVQRQKMEMVITMENLPQELVSNILSRLPARKLLKCKCVCKSWLHLIADPHFTTNYYSFHNQIYSQEEHLLAIQRPFFPRLKTNISLLSLTFNDPKNHVNSTLLNLPEEYNSDHKYWSEIMGPCNGIYFLQGNPNVLMNPSLRQFKSLPESHLTDSNGIYSLTDYASFGFDPKSNDYKVVMLKDIWLKETDDRQKGFWTAELYSHKSNSWRKLDAKTLPLPIEICGSSLSRVYTYVNNCCHWWSFVNNESAGIKEDFILSFDMVNEVFRKIKVPKICESSKETFATLAPFEKSSTIGVIVYPIRGNVKHFDVWMMRDYWDEGSWIKQYSVGPIEYVVDRLMVFNGSNRFLWKCNNDELVLNEHQSFFCDESQKRRDLKVRDYDKFDDSFRVVVYKESLVSLQSGA